MKKSKKQGTKFYQIKISSTTGLLIIGLIGLITSLLIMVKVNSTFEDLQGLTPDQVADTLSYQEILKQ